MEATLAKKSPQNTTTRKDDPTHCQCYAANSPLKVSTKANQIFSLTKTHLICFLVPFACCGTGHGFSTGTSSAVYVVSHFASQNRPKIRIRDERPNVFHRCNIKFYNDSSLKCRKRRWDNAKGLSLNLSFSSESLNEGNERASVGDYFSAMRPVTILQAVGAFLVGRLVILSQARNSTNSASIVRHLPSLLFASLSIYFGYGSGMVMNDCADAGVDSQHGEKQNRSIASNKISVKKGWVFCAALSLLSLACACIAESTCGTNFNWMALFEKFGFEQWTLLNLLLMISYALGMQKIFLMKNIICGWLAVSPLIGASILGGLQPAGGETLAKMYRLAAIGFPLQISREILKDIEDVDVDRGQKQTLPLVIGESKSKLFAYSIVALVNSAMIFSPHYWNMFASNPPLYAISVFLGTPMCVRASMLPLSQGQKLLKKSIYVLLVGMISSLLIQSW